MTEHDFPPERDVHDALNEPATDPQVDPCNAKPHEASRPERRRAGH